MPLALKWKARSWPPANLVCTSAGRHGSAIKQELSRHGHRGLPIEIVGATEVITMTIRLRRRSAARRKAPCTGCALGARRKAEAMVSAGNTGAAMTVARFVLGTLLPWTARARRRISEHER